MATPEELMLQYRSIDEAAHIQQSFVERSLLIGLIAEVSGGEFGLHAVLTREDIAYWLDQGAPIDGVQRIEYGDGLDHFETPLVTALVENRIETAELLIQNGADVDAPHSVRLGPGQGGYMFTALHTCAQRGIVDGVRLLIEYGADVNKQTTLGNTALHFAAGKDNLEIVRLLLQAGADPHIRELPEAGEDLGELPLDQAGDRTRSFLKLAMQTNTYEEPLDSLQRASSTVQHNDSIKGKLESLFEWVWEAGRMVFNIAVVAVLLSALLGISYYFFKEVIQENTDTPLLAVVVILLLFPMVVAIWHSIANRESSPIVLMVFFGSIVGAIVPMMVGIFASGIVWEASEFFFPNEMASVEKEHPVALEVASLMVISLCWGLILDRLVRSFALDDDLI